MKTDALRYLLDYQQLEEEWTPASMKKADLVAAVQELKDRGPLTAAQIHERFVPEPEDHSGTELEDDEGEAEPEDEEGEAVGEDEDEEAEPEDEEGEAEPVGEEGEAEPEDAPTAPAKTAAKPTAPGKTAAKPTAPAKTAETAAKPAAKPTAPAKTAETAAGPACWVNDRLCNSRCQPRSSACLNHCRECA